MSAPLPADESRRLQSLYRLNILDTSPEPAFDDLTLVASAICETTISLVTFVDSDRLWFKSRVGMQPPETQRDFSFCSHTILQSGLLEIPDARQDSRFQDSPMVREDPNIVFYAGVPLCDGAGHALGALCVMDTRPRQLSRCQQEALLALARQASTQLLTRELNQRRDLLVASCQDGHWDWPDMEASAWWWSPSCFDLLGISPDLQPTLDLVTSLIHPEDLSRLQTLREDGAELGSLVDVEAPLRVGQDFRWFLVRALGSESSQGRRRRLTGSLSDIHDRKEGEDALRLATREAQAASQAKSVFLERMSHELRTPLNAVIGFSEVLQDQIADRLTDKEARFLNNIQRSGQHLLSIVSDVLEIVRLDGGRLSLELEPVHLGESVRLALTRASQIGAAPSITVTLPPELDCWVLADPRALHQIFFQLLSNAFKFTSEGGRVAVTLDSLGDEVVVAVRDNGIGIPPKDQQRVFQEFSQLNEGLSRNQDGTGLGLALVKRLMESQGQFWLESSGVPGEGCVFYLQLSRSEPGSSTLVNALPRSPRSARVLLVEPDRPVRQLLDHYLSEAGYETLAARSSSEALRLADAVTPDLICLGLDLEAKGGPGLLHLMRERESLRKVPILLLSACSSWRGDDEQQLELGIGLQLEKPVTRDVLLEYVSRLIV